jgi:hypothetical protein
MPSKHPLVPKHKHDIETARLACEAGYPAVEPVLYELLEWIKDYSWPVAQELVPFLASIGEPLAPHIRRVLAGDDYIWQYWICELFQESAALYSIFRQEIHRIASFPTTEERTEELDERCIHIIAIHEPSLPDDRGA